MIDDNNQSLVMWLKSSLVDATDEQLRLLTRELKAMLLERQQIRATAKYLKENPQ